MSFFFVSVSCFSVDLSLSKKKKLKKRQTLRVNEKLAEQLLLSRGGAPSEADARGAAVVEVSCRCACVCVGGSVFRGKFSFHFFLNLKSSKIQNLSHLVP